MDHSFSASQFDALKCAKCKRIEIDHTDRATCECCSNSGNMTIFTDMLMCPDCIKKEMETAMEHQSLEKQEERMIEHNNLLELSRKIDYNVQVKEDIFNAETVSINELKTAIESDPAIENKQYKLAEVLLERYTHFKSVIFELNSQIVAETNKQRATQTYLNQLANKLRQEEREKLKLQDINYKPGEIKPVKTKAPSKRSIDIAELKELAGKLGIPHTALQMMCVSRGISPKEAYEEMKKALGV